ncbi:uncharacterized protein MELLADRAFT_73644 [Melampsora larici-populina 98AG31]|uniref:Uncharacterized protein n=1 Tax=Melampsora larici-populina (strain 98AG31 / pathotype 3-4-7) TaxID=747676 RepID=F4SAZ6_MELLP|nr:uncharacterized protein MELLADRAFT_73644 [Melampsora larici-populina 98AG31]EGF98196.1 hypothetical protein MELLADRAFT_73644 [Melampsora larici-populina 98AG31]
MYSKRLRNEETSIPSPFIQNRHEKDSRQDSLVVGSRKHTASELAGVLSKFSDFQFRLSSSNNQNEDELSITPSIETDGYSNYNKQSNQKLGVNQHLGGNSSNSGSRSSSASPLPSPSITSFSQRLIRSISSTSNTPTETINDHNSKLQISPDNLKRKDKLSPGLQLNTNRFLNHHNYKRLDANKNQEDRLMVSTSLVLRNPEERIKVGEIFWIEVVLVNSFERLRKTGAFEVGVIGNEIIGLDDMMLIGPLEEGESGSVRIRCVAMKSGIWSVSVIMRKRNFRKQQIRLMDAVLVGVVA